MGEKPPSNGTYVSAVSYATTCRWLASGHRTRTTPHPYSRPSTTEASDSRLRTSFETFSCAERQILTHGSVRDDEDFDAAIAGLAAIAPEPADFVDRIKRASISRIATSRYLLREIELAKRERRKKWP